MGDDVIDNAGERVYRLADLRQGMLLQSGRHLYQVSTIYDRDRYEDGGYFTATLVVQDGGSPGRTKVHTFHAEELMQFKSPGETILRQYEDVYDLPRIRRD